MKRTMLITIGAMLVLVPVLTGCENQDTAGEPPLTLGPAPGEETTYETYGTEPAGSGATDFGATQTDNDYIRPIDDSGDTASTGNYEAAETSTPQPERVYTPPTSPQTYTTKRGDTLYSLARRFYGDGKQWTRIYNANRSKIPAPEKMPTGISLTIPQ